MAATRRAILSAIAAETAERSGPMPPWLVPVAVNARGKAERHAVAAELIAMRAAGLIDCRGNHAQGSGVTLTDAGRAELRRTKPLAKSTDAKRACRPTSPSEPVPTPVPATAPTIDPEHVGHDQPALFALLCDLAGMVSERLAIARETADIDEMARLRGLGKRIQHHTGGPR